jgi:hypothetical protein
MVGASVGECVSPSFVGVDVGASVGAAVGTPVGASVVKVHQHSRFFPLFAE